MTLIALCDGIGGHCGGDMASLSCCRSFLLRWRDPASAEERAADPGKFLRETAQESTLNLFLRNQRERFPRPMGCTLAAGIVKESGFHFINVGDSRIYLLSPEEHAMRQLTTDDVPEIPAPGGCRSRTHCITGAVGISPVLSPHTGSVPLREGSRLLFCTDGLFGEVGTERIEEIMKESGDPRSAASSLIREALVSGGRDNVSVICVFR